MDCFGFHPVYQHSDSRYFNFIHIAKTAFKAAKNSAYSLFSVLINFVGYLIELNADTKELALQAVKFNYWGKPYIILGSFLFVMEYFKVRFPRVIKHALIMFHIGITFLVSTCNHHSLFYTTIDFVDEGIFPHLVLGHGVFYFLFYLFVAVYLFILLWVGIRQFRIAKGKKEKRQVFYINLIPIVCSLSLLIFLSGITGGYDATIPAYLSP